MRQIALARLLPATLALFVTTPASSEAQNSIVTGRITNPSGAAVGGATVTILETGAVFRVGPSGVFEFVFDSSVARGQLVQLRVRAGDETMMKAARVAPGTHTVNFQLTRGDTARIAQMMSKAAKAVPAMDTVITKNPAFTKYPASGGGGRGAAPARELYSAQRGVEIPIAVDPFNRYLFQPELVMRYQDAIALTEDQRLKLQTAMEDAQKRAVQVQWALALENEKLQKALEKPVVDEKETIGAMDRIVGVEREMKRAQLELLVKIKNTLTQDQQERLKKLRGFDD